MSSIRWRMKAWNRPWLWSVFCGRHLSSWPFHLWTENKKCFLLVLLGRQSQPKCTSKPQARTQLSLTTERSMRSLLTLRTPWGLDKFQFFVFFGGSLENILFSSGSSQLWVGPRTLSSAELAWWPGAPMDRFWFKQFFFVLKFLFPFQIFFFKFFFPFQIFSCIFFPYQVERTTFFEGTDVEFAQLSEEVIWVLVAIVFAL